MTPGLLSVLSVALGVAIGLMLVVVYYLATLIGKDWGRKP
jgi:hypothetical protein